MSKEWLEEIKEKAERKSIIKNYPYIDVDNPVTFLVTIEEKHFNYLIEQAERVQELEGDNEYLRGTFIPFLQDNTKELERQNKRYREALEFYANKNKYMYKSTSLKGHPTIISDEGEIARKALEGEE